MIDGIRYICRSITKTHASALTIFQLWRIVIILLCNLQRRHGGKGRFSHFILSLLAAFPDNFPCPVAPVCHSKVSCAPSANQLANPGFVLLCGCFLMHPFLACAILICHKAVWSRPPAAVQTIASFSDSSLLKLLSVFFLRSIKFQNHLRPPETSSLACPLIQPFGNRTINTFSTSHWWSRDLTVLDWNGLMSSLHGHKCQ